MLKPEDLELHIGKFVKISVFHGDDLVVTSYGTICYENSRWSVRDTIGDIGDCVVYFDPIFTEIVEDTEPKPAIQELWLVCRM